MAEYNVIFTRYYEYTVEANSETEAESKAKQLFKTDCCRPVANTDYDEIEVGCLNKDEDFVPIKAFVEPEIPNTVEPLTADVLFPEFVDE